MRHGTKAWLLAFVLTAGFFAHAQSTNDSTTSDFSSFQIVVQRNIFDPNRYPREMPRFQQRDEGAPAFSLAGTMSYRKGMFAFFSGSRDEYQKALQDGGTVAGYTVTNITFDGCDLIAGGKTIPMKVGAAMRQDGSGGWELVEPTQWGLSRDATVVDVGSPTAETNSTSLPSSGEQNDVLKRLMQRREEQERK